MNKEEELKIYRDLLINLHTARWTGNVKKVNKILDLIGEYSYARTNSNGVYEDDLKNQEFTLNKLKGI